MTRRERAMWAILAVLAGCILVLTASTTMRDAAGASPLSVTIERITPGGAIPTDFAFCVPAAQGHVTLGPNKSPAITWSTGPAGTASYAIITVDRDVPSVFDSVNKEGQTIPATLRRIDFYHWILVDIPATMTGLPLGADSDGVTPHGKKPGPTPNGVRGVNDYTLFFPSDPKMAGAYGGYDGPCPPWNDTIVHHYHFIVYALNVPRLGLSGKFTGPQALKAIQPHVLAQGEVVGLYTLNPDVAKRLGIKW
jgi:Raf kinase inhibitor-like YbhB/YbcL family protein